MYYNFILHALAPDTIKTLKQLIQQPDDDGSCRSSALVILASLCHHAIHAVLMDLDYIIDYCTTLLQFQHNSEPLQVRRGACLVLVELMKGIQDMNHLSAMDGHGLKRVYRTLSNLAKNENEDPVLCVHAKDGLVFLEEAMTGDIYRGMSRRIQILR
jgi:hypothetical protein